MAHSVYRLDTPNYTAHYQQDGSWFWRRENQSGQEGMFWLCFLTIFVHQKRPERSYWLWWLDLGLRGWLVRGGPNTAGSFVTLPHQQKKRGGRPASSPLETHPNN
jgi:hypothetical protein